MRPLNLHGIIPPLVTPLRGPDELDHAGLERLIAHVLGGGVHGIFLLGTTGEGPSLGYRLREEMVRSACRLVAGRVPVLVGITDTSRAMSLQMAQVAAEAGAQVLVAAPPYYFPNRPAELLDYYRELVAALPLPLLLYNMPVHTKTFLEPAFVAQAMEIPGIIGIKDSSGNMGHFHLLLELAKHRPDWITLMGPEELLGESVLFGGRGGACGGANLCPTLYVEAYEAARAGDVVALRQLQERILAVTGLYQLGHNGPSLIPALKCALRERGICEDYVEAPLQRFQDGEREQVRGLLKELGL